MNSIFYQFAGVITPQDVWRTRKKFVNHEPEMSDLQTFQAFSNVSIFYEITGAINDNFLTQQGSRNMSVIS